MKYFLYSTIIFFLVAGNGCQNPSKKLESTKDPSRFESVTSIIVYDIWSDRTYKESYAPSKRLNVKKAHFDLDLFKRLIPSMKYSNKNLIWKGGRLAIVTFPDNTELPISISCYGSFFIVMDERGFYCFSDDPSAAKWYTEVRDRIVCEEFLGGCTPGMGPHARPR